MNCRKAHLFFEDYFLGNLKPDIRLELENHLNSCPDCINKLEFYRSYFQHKPDMPIITPDNRFNQKILAKIRELDQPVKTNSGRWVPALVSASAAVVIIGLGLIGLQNFTFKQNTQMSMKSKETSVTITESTDQDSAKMETTLLAETDTKDSSKKIDLMEKNDLQSDKRPDREESVEIRKLESTRSTKTPLLEQQEPVYIKITMVWNTSSNEGMASESEDSIADDQSTQSSRDKSDSLTLKKSKSSDKLSAELKSADEKRSEIRMQPVNLIEKKQIIENLIISEKGNLIESAIKDNRIYIRYEMPQSQLASFSQKISQYGSFTLPGLDDQNNRTESIRQFFDLIIE